MKTIYLAGGCFWGVQSYFKQLEGVVNTEVGYANGDGNTATYENLKNSGHAEAIRIDYDPDLLPLELLLQHYFRIIDPTLKNRQGNDIGPQYRTGIYTVDASDEAIVQEALVHLQALYTQKIQIETEPLKNYIPAESYHQDYLDKNPGGYCHIDPSLAQKPLYGTFRFVKPSDEGLKKSLSPLAYRVTQQDATEAPGTSPLNFEDRPGIYVDITTGEPLFSSDHKFDAGCGWPSFTRPLAPDTLAYNEDLSHGMRRVETRSKIGDAHLGHVFEDGPADAGGLRFCINGAALRFIPYEDMDDAGYGDYKHFVTER